jgi:hypothetical protein
MENKMNTERIVFSNSTLRSFDFLKDNEAEEGAIARAVAFYSEALNRLKDLAENFTDDDYWKKRATETQALLEAGFSVLPFEQYLAKKNKSYTDIPMTEITAEHYNEQLDILPPIYWCTIDGITMFCMSEMTDGTITSQYAHDLSTDKYYTKLVDIYDKSTWLHKALKGAEQ